MRLRKPSPAMLVALLALFVALGGSSYAAIALSKNSVKSKHIAQSAVKRSEIAKGAVNSAKVADFSLLAQDFKSGQLPAGPQGPQGTQGRGAGAQGRQGRHRRTRLRCRICGGQLQRRSQQGEEHLFGEHHAPRDRRLLHRWARLRDRERRRHDADGVHTGHPGPDRAGTARHDKQHPVWVRRRRQTEGAGGRPRRSGSYAGRTRRRVLLCLARGLTPPLRREHRAPWRCSVAADDPRLRPVLLGLQNRRLPLPRAAPRTCPPRAAPRGTRAGWRSPMVAQRRDFLEQVLDAAAQLGVHRLLPAARRLRGHRRRFSAARQSGNRREVGDQPRWWRQPPERRIGVDKRQPLKGSKP